MSFNFYHTPQWRKLRALKIKNNPLCLHCERKGYLNPATEVDHIIPIVDDQSLALDYSNLQSLCKSCHSRKTAKENQHILNAKPKDRMAEKMKNFLK